MITTYELNTYIDAYAAFNEMPPQLKSFINGLKAINDGARLKRFTHNGMFYTIMLPLIHYKGTNISTKTRKFIANNLLKKDIKEVSVAEFNNILRQIFPFNICSYLPTYLFLRDTYNDKCRHTVIKYYSLDNPK